MTDSELKARYETQLNEALDAIDRILLTGEAYEIGTGSSKRSFTSSNLMELESYVNRLRVKINQLDNTKNKAVTLRAGW